jgi:hypothetical protein
MSRGEKKRLRRRARAVASIVGPWSALKMAFEACAPRSAPQDRRYGEMLLAELLRRGTMPPMMGMELVAPWVSWPSDRLLRDLLFARA